MCNLFQFKLNLHFETARALFCVQFASQKEDAREKEKTENLIDIKCSCGRHN